ncbi:MAG TPA: cysteine--tRNA ligase [Bacteroidetes bacterium]|nr:cysteine--tRNA ligase [Bacteroidota bacterium]
MSLTIYNTLTRKKEEFIPVESGKVGFYLCGPTVYDYFHIGNARPFIVFDVFRRFLQYRGFEVTYVVNITDVDDKIINKSNQENRAPKEIADEYTKAYLEDLKKLKVKLADVLPKATEHISDMIALIRELLDHGIAYTLNGDVYFSVEKYNGYGKLSGKHIEDLKAGARVEVDERKNNPLDFALWKAAKPGEPFWEAPWGKGRPGWHIECSAMSMKYLGDRFDIHAGGEDLIFPHHENEIAQSCGTGKHAFAKYWLHNGFLKIRGEKMAKSKRNFLTAREILKRYPAEVLRLFFLQKHYRSPINYSEEILDETQVAWHRLQNFYRELNAKKLPEINEIVPDRLSAPAQKFFRFIEQNRSEMAAALEDDFNSAKAIGKLFEIVKEGNRLLNSEEISTDKQVVLNYLKKKLEEFDDFLGLLSREADNSSSENDLEAILEILLEVRNELRENKMWELADKIRNRLTEAGFSIEDRAKQSIIKKNKS